MSACSCNYTDIQNGRQGIFVLYRLDTAEVMDVTAMGKESTSSLPRGYVNLNIMIEPVVFDQLPLFRGIDEDSLHLLAPHFERATFRSGSVVFKQGDPARYLFILLNGSVSIEYKPPDGEVLAVAEIGEHNVFGWSAALGHRDYSSSAICTETCDVLIIQGQSLQELCQDHPETGVVILERLAGVIAQRLRNTHEHVVSMLKNGINPPA